MDIFTLIYPFSPLSPSLLETARYRLKYCLKGPLNPKQPTKPREREKEREIIDERKNVQTTPTRTYCKHRRPLPFSYPNKQDAPALVVCPAPLHHLTTPNLQYVPNVSSKFEKHLFKMGVGEDFIIQTTYPAMHKIAKNDKVQKATIPSTLILEQFKIYMHIFILPTTRMQDVKTIY